MRSISFGLVNWTRVLGQGGNGLSAEDNTLISGPALNQNRPTLNQYDTQIDRDYSLPGITLPSGCWHCDATGSTTEETYAKCDAIGSWKECAFGAGFNFVGGDFDCCMIEEIKTRGEVTSLCTGCKDKTSCENNRDQNFGASNTPPVMTQCRPEDALTSGRFGPSVCRQCFPKCPDTTLLCFATGVNGYRGIPRYDDEFFMVTSIFYCEFSTLVYYRKLTSTN